MRKITNKSFILAIFIPIMAVIALNTPNFAYASHTSSHTIAELQAQIVALQAKLNTLLAIKQEKTLTLADCGFTRNLFLGTAGEDVKCLQKYLNSAGFTIASSGPGSPGSETTFYGSLTKAAAAKWQAANEVSPSVGYFGTISRTKYNSLLAAIPPSSPFGEVGGTLEEPESTITELNITASSNQPRSGLAPQGAARVPFTRVTFTAPANKDVTVKSLTVQMRGFADTAAFESIIAINDENGVQIGLAKTLNANKKAILNESFAVKAGTSRTITIAANMAASLSAYQGQLAQLALVEVDAGSIPVIKGSLPIVGNEMTINSTLIIGTASMTRGSTDPGASQTKEIDNKSLTFAAVRITAGSQEDITLESIRFNQIGSISSSDLANVQITVENTDFPASISSDGRFYYANFGEGITILKGGSKEIAIKSDIISGSNRTINFDVLRKTDIVARGNFFKYYLTPSGGSSGAAAEGNFSSDQEPFYNGFTVTVSKGSLRVEKSNAVPAGNITKDSSNTLLGSFTFEAKGEGIQITKLVINIATVGSGTASDVSNVSVYDEKETLVAGPKDPSGGNVTFTDSWTIPVDSHVYTVKGKLSTAFATNDTVILSVTPSAITAKGELSGLTIIPSPSTSVSANTRTVKAASLSTSVSPTPIAQTVIAGINGYTFASYQLDATASGEDIRINSFKLRDTYAGSPGTTDIYSCQLFDGGIALETGSNAVNPVLDGTSPDDFTFTLDNGVIIPAGTVKVIDLKCSISANAALGSSHSWGINSGVSGNVTAVGKNTGSSVSANVNSAAGQAMTIASQGTITISLDPSSLPERFGLSGAADVFMTNLKIEAGAESLRLDKIGLVMSLSTASTADISRVTLWNGVTKLGEAIFTGTNNAVTANLTQPLVIPKDSSKILTIKADLASVGTNQSGTTGHLITLNYNGSSPTATQSIGQSSGKTINPSSGPNTAAKGVRLVKTMAVLEQISIPSNTLSNGEQILYRLKVAADSKGDVGIYKFNFKTSTAGGASLSNFSLYGYSDQGFSSQAYAKNPLNTTPVASADGSGFVEIYFNPISGGSNEAINVPAGTTRYFELRGTITGAVSGASASISLEGDAAYIASGYIDTASGVDSDTNDDFIWSPNTTTTAVPATSDWLNGFLVQGLPSTNMSAQILSK